ncbi:hypothetical protein Lesp02_47790 [Lentzea sp. NBRC 105346]|uniref:hypothetical protein n=1 Tax=Lentzea sp. NBRC 105346 TaxID=3032205 RepID=UPI0024A087A2|nr:hypothetical protein [Lentzea sp. NBRC 105346]GLZ32591.1 hypothetical protein Lesp02_47790 [Lentzea sp. NBRC 105346]
MKNTIKTLLVVGTAGLALVACGPGENGAGAVGTTMAPATTSASVTKVTPPVRTIVETRTETVVVPAKEQADTRLGYGKLKLGMTRQEAEATGLLGQLDQEQDGCRLYRLAENPAFGPSVAIAEKSGVVKIRLPAGTKTSKGIGTGSSVADLKQAYPNAMPYRIGYRAEIEGGVTVDLKVFDTGVVQGIGLASANPGDCQVGAYL